MNHALEAVDAFHAHRNGSEGAADMQPEICLMRATWDFLGTHGLFGAIHARSQCTCELNCAATWLQRLSEPAGSYASCRTSCRCGACAPGMGAWTGGVPSKLAASVFCTATLSRPHHRLCQPWAAAPRSGAGARKARERTSCDEAERLVVPTSAGLAREHAQPLRSSPKELGVGSALAAFGDGQGSTVPGG